MPSFAVDIVSHKKVLEHLGKEELKSLMGISKRWNDLIAGILWKRKGQLVLLEAPKDWNNVEINEFLRQQFAPNPKRPYKIESLSDGRSKWASVYKLTVNNEAFVIRKIHGRAPIDCIREITLATYYGNLNVAPKVIFSRADKKTLIIEFANNSKQLLQVHITPEILKELAHSLQILHNGPQYVLPRDVRQDTLSALEIRHVKKLVSEFPQLRDYSKAIGEIEKIAGLVDDVTSCHNDLHPLNILSGARVLLIDWEHAGRADPCLDLASIMAYLHLSPEHKKLFLAHYFGKNEPSSAIMAKIAVFEAFVLMKMSICFLAKVAHLGDVFAQNLNESPDTSPESWKKLPDLSTDAGRYTLSRMLLKDGMSKLSMPDYQESFALVPPPKRPLFSLELEELTHPLTMNICMLVLEGFIAIAGIAAIAIAFTLLNAATLGVSGLVVAGVGAAAILSGVGLFATRSCENSTAIRGALLNVPGMGVM